MDRAARERALGGKVRSKRAGDWHKLALLLRHYWHRLAGAALGWFASDFYYCALLFGPRTIVNMYPVHGLGGIDNLSSLLVAEKRE